MNWVPIKYNLSVLVLLLTLTSVAAASEGEKLSYEHISSYLANPQIVDPVLEKSISEELEKSPEALAIHLRKFAGEADTAELDFFEAYENEKNSTKKRLYEYLFTYRALSQGKINIEEGEKSLEFLSNEWFFAEIMKEDTCTRFFTELKQPTKDSLAFIKQTIFDDMEYRNAVDKETGYPPAGIIITSYPTVSSEQKKLYKEIFTYLLDAETNCAYAMENNPCSVVSGQVEDLKEIYEKHNKYDNLSWEQVLSCIANPPDQWMRLMAVSEKLEKLVTVDDEESATWFLQEAMDNDHLFEQGLAEKITPERFYGELKNPTKDSLAYIQRAVRTDMAYRFKPDGDTGYSPVGIILSSYASATAEEKELYKEIFTYLLQMYAPCYYMVPKVPIIKKEEVKDLQDLYAKHNRCAQYTWTDVIGSTGSENSQNDEDSNTSTDASWVVVLAVALGGLYYYLSGDQQAKSPTKILVK